MTTDSSEDGDEQSYIAIVRDLTQQRIAREAIDANRQRTEQAHSSRAAFLQLASDELRGPLNGIISLSKLILEQKEARNNPPDHGALVRDIHDCGMKLHSAIDYIVSLAQSDPRQGEEDEPVCLRTTMDSALDEAAIPISAKSLQVHKQYSDQPLVPGLSPSHAMKIVGSLLDYAVSSSKPQGVVAITLTAGITGEMSINIGVDQDELALRNTNREGSLLHDARALAEIFGGSCAVEEEFSGTRRITALLPKHI